MSSTAVKILLGGWVVGNADNFKTSESIEQLLSTASALGISTLDTAQIYGPSEKLLGEHRAGDRFTIDTKWMGSLEPGWATKEYIVKSAKESLDRLGMKQVDVFYLHAPDPKTPFEETLAGVNEVYKLGSFRRFGLSNFLAADVQKVYDIAKENGYVLPTVYQGNYSAVARHQEALLYPTLRKLNISFYAYSALAGGFFSKDPEQITAGVNRFSADQLGGMYRKLYGKPSYLLALKKWGEIAAEESVPKQELALRWIVHNSILNKANGDGVVIGASSTAQIEESVRALEKGPISDKAVKAIDEIWEGIKDDAPLDNINQTVAK